MNATQTLILQQLAASNSYHSVAELVEMTGKGETTIRENLKKMLAEGDVQKDGKLYTNTPIVPEEAELPAEPVEIEPEPEAPQAEPVAAETAPEAAKPRKKYVRHEKPQTRTTRINQITKAEIGVRKTDEDPRQGITTKWYAVCLTHDAATGEEKLLDAHAHSTYPTFCPTCAPQLVGKIGRRRRGGADAVSFIK